MFLSTRVKESDLAKLYPEAYHPYQGRPATSANGRSLPESFARALHRGVGRVSRELPRMTAKNYEPPRAGARFVDFGCGSTAFLDHAAARGWSAIGVDFVPSVVDRVRQEGYQGYLVDECWKELGEGTIDALRLNHVLEHLYDPWSIMGRLTALLADGGRLHVAVPNPDGVGALLFRRDWLSFDARHAILWGPRQASGLLRQLGFRDIRVVHEVVTKDMARSWGYRRARRGRMELHEVLGLPDRPGLNASMAIPAKLAALLGRGDRFHIFARK